MLGEFEGLAKTIALDQELVSKLPGLCKYFPRHFRMYTHSDEDSEKLNNCLIEASKCENMEEWISLLNFCMRTKI